MSGALIFWGYVAVWLVYGWRLSVTLLDARVRQAMKRYPRLYSGAEGAKAVADEDRGLYLVAGFGLAVAWPAVATARGVYRLIVDRGALRTPIERELAEKAELEALRKLAREHGLPMPEVKS